jgi:gamma-glutamyltranspeptidase/glutathione hydrolase/leukotriene-C4 hydrolase
MPLPGSGLLLSFILRVIETYDDINPNARKSLNSSILFYHRLVETFKYAYSQRMLLGDDQFDDVKSVVTNFTSQLFINNINKSIEDSQTYNNYSDYGADVYIKPDEGTAHVSVVEKFGNAAAVSTTVNMYCF